MKSFGIHEITFWVLFSFFGNNVLATHEVKFNYFQVYACRPLRL